MWSATGCRGTVLLAPLERVENATPPVDALAPRMLSAQISELPRGSSKARQVVVVFDRPLDPSTLRPEALVVMRNDGEVARVESVALNSSAAWDDARTVFVTLEDAAWVDAAAHPVAIHVVRRLYARDGRSLRGTRVEIRALERPDELVDAVLETRKAACGRGEPGAGLDSGVAAQSSKEPLAWVVRTHWSDVVRAKTAESVVAGVSLTLASGRRLQPYAATDVARDAIDRHTDNVVDFCFTLPGPEHRAHEFSVPAGSLVDGAGRASAAAQWRFVEPAGS